MAMEQQLFGHWICHISIYPLPGSHLEIHAMKDYESTWATLTTMIEHESTWAAHGFPRLRLSLYDKAVSCQDSIAVSCSKCHNLKYSCSKQANPEFHSRVNLSCDVFVSVYIGLWKMAKIRNPKQIVGLR